MFENLMKEGLNVFLANVQSGTRKFLDDALKTMHRRIMKTALDITFMFLGMVAMTVGVILLLSRYLPIDVSLIVVGTGLFIVSYLFDF